ncbi:MAG: transporter substrate-binding protein [Bacilli bacterium]|jgi:multiple sugar transport system substrate-binding protein|nr:transporter substrate-binding protein [Bacilli bacterium]
MLLLKKKFSIFIILFGIISLLSACSANKTVSVSESPAGTTASNDGKKVKLVMWGHQEDAFIASNKKIIEQYQALHSNVTIEYQQFPYEAYNQKLKASFASKNAPDLAEVFGTWMPEYNKNGLMAEVPFSDEVKKDYYAAPLGAYTWMDKLYGVPLEFNIENGGMLVHPKMFKDAGISYPKTWTELVDAAKKLTVRNGDEIKVKGFDFVSSDNITYTLLSLILQQNGKYWGGNSHINLSTPEAVKAMTALKELVTVDKVADLSSFGGELDTSDFFFKGNSAMTYRGPWTIANGQGTYKVNDFEYAPVPSFTSNPPSFAAESGWGLVVAKNSKYTKEAWDFVQYFSNAENSRAWNIGTSTIPPKKQVVADPKFIEAMPMVKPSLDVLQYGQWIGLLWDRDYFFKQVNDNFQLIASEKLTVEQGLKKIEDAVNQSQDQHK